MPGTVQKVAPAIAMITPEQKPGSAWESPNLYLVGEDRLTLIDAGYDKDADIELILETVGAKKLELIVLTHGHIDHAGGVAKLRDKTGARAAAHQADWPSIQRRFPGVVPDLALEDGDVLTAGPHRLRVALLPGHSPGHIGLFVEQSGILFTGDLVTGQGSTLVAPPEGRMKSYMDSLERVSKMPVKKILPGHGPVRDDPEGRIAELIEHRKLREVCLLKCMLDADGPIKLNDLVKAMYMGLIHPQMMGPAAWTAWAHLGKLIEEHMVSVSPENETNPFNMEFSLMPGVAEKVLEAYKS